MNNIGIDRHTDLLYESLNYSRLTDHTNCIFARSKCSCCMSLMHCSC